MRAFLDEDHPLQKLPLSHKLTVTAIQSDENKKVFGDLDLADARSMLTSITDEYNCINGMKDGIIKFLLITFGDYLTQLTKDSKKSNLCISKISIPKLIDLIKKRAEHPSNRECLAQKQQFLAQTLDFQAHFTTNHAEFEEQAKQLKDLFGVEITPNDMKLMYLPQLEAASKEPWGSQLRDAVRDIKSTFTYGTIFDDVNLQSFVEIVEKYDDERNLHDAPDHFVQSSTQSTPTG